MNGITIANFSNSIHGNDISFGLTSTGERVFSTSGQVLDISTLSVVQDFGLTGLVKADPVVGRVFFLTQKPPPASTTWTISAFNISAPFAPTGSLDIPGVIGKAGSFIRWGTSGLAFRTDSGQVFLIATALVPPPAP